MSELALTANSNDLLALAEELNISIDNSINEMYSGGGVSKYTNYNRPKGLRSLFDAHQLKGVLTWTEEGFSGLPTERQGEELYKEDPNGGEPRSIGAVTGLRGVVVNYQQRDELRYFDGEKTVVKCSVIGYQKSGETVRDLPNIPYGMKHTFEKTDGKWSVNDTKPNPMVEKLGLVGFRGERPTSCADCIRCGLSTEIIPGIGENGADKKISCEARGKLFFAVFEVETKQRVRTESKVKGKASYSEEQVSIPVSDLVDFEGTPIGEMFLLEVNMSKSSIQGKYVKGSDGKKDVDASVDGYESFVRSLSYEYKNPKDPLRNPLFHFVRLTYRKNPGKAPTYQADFRSLGAVPVDQLKLAMTTWREQTPERTVDTLEVAPVQSIQADGTVNVTAQSVSPTVVSAPAAAPVMKTVQAVQEPVVEVLSEDELPF